MVKTCIQNITIIHRGTNSPQFITNLDHYISIDSYKCKLSNGIISFSQLHLEVATEKKNKYHLKCTKKYPKHPQKSSKFNYFYTNLFKILLSSYLSHLFSTYNFRKNKFFFIFLTSTPCTPIWNLHEVKIQFQSQKFFYF